MMANSITGKMKNEREIQMNYTYEKNISYDYNDAMYCGGRQRQDQMFRRGYKKEYPRHRFNSRDESVWDMLKRLSREYDDVIFCWEANRLFKGQRIYFAMVRGEKQK